MNSNNLDQSPRKTGGPIWPWLVALVLILLAIYAYGRVTDMVDDLFRTMDDLVQLFEWILPDRSDLPNG